MIPFLSPHLTQERNKKERKEREEKGKVKKKKSNTRLFDRGLFFLAGKAAAPA